MTNRDFNRKGLVVNNSKSNIYQKCFIPQSHYYCTFNRKKNTWLVIRLLSHLCNETRTKNRGVIMLFLRKSVARISNNNNKPPGSSYTGDAENLYVGSTRDVLKLQTNFIILTPKYDHVFVFFWKHQQMAVKSIGLSDTMRWHKIKNNFVVGCICILQLAESSSSTFLCNVIIRRHYVNVIQTFSEELSKN